MLSWTFQATGNRIRQPGKPKCEDTKKNWILKTEIKLLKAQSA